MSSSKINVAKQAIDYIKDKLHPEMILGIGTGSTVNFFIEELGAYKNLFAGAVSSSEASSNLLNEKGIEVFNLNDVIDIAYYIDGADEVSPNYELIKEAVALIRERKSLHLLQMNLCVLLMKQN